MIDRNNYDFSFSGLKTAVKLLHEKNTVDTASLAKEFEDAVADVLVTKTIKAALNTHAKTIILGGGVSANRTLRARMSKEAEKNNIITHYPLIELCTDNAIYIACAAYFYLNNVKKVKFDVENLKKITPKPGLTILDSPFSGSLDN
jgi:N6-L-threonylcarbamoyladenine synthase